MRILICFMLLIISNVMAVRAQVPGYMGKRWLISVDVNPMPAIINQNFNNAATINWGGEDARPVKSNALAMNIRPQITVEYLVHRDIGLGLSYSMIRTGTTRAYEQGVELPDDYDHLQDPDVIKGNALGLHFKLYSFGKSASIAPIGFYHTFSVYMTQTNTYDDKKATAKQFKNDFLYPVISYGAGKQKVLGNRFLIKAGIELGWPIVPTNYITSAHADGWTVQDESGYNVHGSLVGYFLFNFNFAVGVLAF